MRITTPDQPISGRRSGLTPSRLVALMGLLSALVFDTAFSYSCSTGKWCDGGSFTTADTYDFIDGSQEEYRMEWEIYEGSIALTQMAIVWKEVSSRSDTLIKRSTGAEVQEVLRVRRIWQMQSEGASLGVYDDENENGQTQIINDFANMEYVNPVPINAAEWFVGDVVPFERCAYIVNMNTDNVNKFYTFIRLQTAVMWDPIRGEKLVVTQQDHVSDTYQRALAGGSVENNDFPEYHVDFGYWPHKGSFFWFNKGTMYIKHDAAADMQDTCDNSVNRCDRSGNVDPCARDTPLFATGTAIAHHYVAIDDDTNKKNFALAWEVVFDSVFVIFARDDQKIFRVGGSAYNNLVASEFYVLGAGASGGITTSYVDAVTVTNDSITTICSMDFYGLFIGVEGASKVIRLELDINNDDADPPLVIYANGVQDIAQVNYFEMAVSNTMHLIQTKSYFERHRPCYVVTSDNPSQLVRLSTQTVDYFESANLATEVDLFTRDWSVGTVPSGPQLQRFHLLSTMPGLTTDTLASLDHDTIKAFMYDMRARKEWGKFALTSSGDGTVDPALGEECDPNSLPPIDLTYDANTSGSFLDQAYPDSDYNTKWSPETVSGKVSWIPANTQEDLSGDTGRTEYIAEGYYQCTSASFLVAYDGCGDGVPSNGPIEVNAFNAAHDPNQRNGVLGFETCDDGNNADGDGCSGDCQTITDGWECLEWGAPCTLKCGNGHIEGFLTPSVDADGNKIVDGNGDDVLIFEYELDENGDIREECDFGTHNAPMDLASAVYADVREYACSSDCKLMEKKFSEDSNQPEYGLPLKWDCTLDLTPIAEAAPKNVTKVVYKSSCTYLCGNKAMDAGEECDLSEWAFDGMSHDGYINAKNGGDVAGWVSTLSDPKVNTDLSLGCTVDCLAVNIAGEAYFKFPTDSYSKEGTDRCGDGIYDGIIQYTNATTGDTITMRSYHMPTPQPGDPDFAPRSAAVTGYEPYWTTEYSGRMLTEQCDNGGDEDHGCDRLCQIVDGWECFHYFHHLTAVETPHYTSICQEIAYPTLTRRRLSPNDFDREGRLLHHLPRKTYLFKLPDNAHEMRASKHTLKYDPKFGLNGQVRLVESKTCSDCFGFTMAYQRDEYTDPDYWYYQISAQSASVASVTDASVDMAALTLKGKQRNTFGAYMVVNKDMNHLEIWGYSTPASDTTFSVLYTTPTEASIEYLGAHEVHWFPYKELLMAKLSDGSSFRLFRMTSDFRAVALAGDGAQPTATKIDPGYFRLFHVPGRTMVHPLFWEKLAYFYISGVETTSTPKLVTYQWNDLTNEFEEKCSKDMTAEGANTSLYHKFSMVNVGDDGIIFSMWGTGTYTLYKCSDSTGSWAYAETTVAFDNSASALTGDQEDLSDTTFDNTAMTLLQAREDPDNYVSGSFPDIYGVHKNGYIQKFSWSSPTLSMTSPSIVVPIEKAITVSPEHMDIGRLYLVLLSPSQCDAEHDVSQIFNASVYYYKFSDQTWTCRELTSITSTMDVSGASYWEHSQYR